MNSKLLLTLAGFATAGSLSAQTLIFSENFGTLANGTTITTTNTAFNYVRAGTGTGASVTAQNPSSFGAGASGLLLATSASLTGVGTTGFTAFNIGTLNFSIQAPTTQGTFFFALGTGATFTGNGTFSSADLTAGFQVTAAGQLQIRTNATTWTNVGTTVLTSGSLYNLSIVFNNSGSTVTYGGNSVANATADIYVNGALVGDDLTINAAQATATALRFYTTGAATTGAYQIDNVALYNGAVAIPEPSAVALGTLGLAGMMALRRRRN